MKIRGCMRKEILHAQTTSVQEGILTSSYQVLVLYRSYYSDSEPQQHIASAELFFNIPKILIFISSKAAIISPTKWLAASRERCQLDLQYSAAF